MFDDASQKTEAIYIERIFCQTKTDADFYVSISACTIFCFSFVMHRTQFAC